ncbi:MAG: T9SS type A sorting domain-containing protein [Bacteroidetes bacterium]|nr:T9SS type A sorting domain-containing protein [Bacteroidota bacterium]
MIYFKDVPADEEMASEIVIYANRNTVVVDNSLNMEGNIAVYDVSGRCVRSVNMENGINTLTPEVMNGIYFVRVKSSAGVVNKKVYIQ